MVRFIALTETSNNRTILINVASIIYVTKGQKEDTYIRVSGAMDDAGKGKTFYFFVKETVEDIRNLLMTDNTRPPVMMTAEEFAFCEANRAHLANGYLPDDGRHRA